jgi:hypothetical protein
MAHDVKEFLDNQICYGCTHGSLHEVSRWVNGDEVKAVCDNCFTEQTFRGEEIAASQWKSVEEDSFVKPAPTYGSVTIKTMRACMVPFTTDGSTNDALYFDTDGDLYYRDTQITEGQEMPTAHDITVYDGTFELKFDPPTEALVELLAGAREEWENRIHSSLAPVLKFESCSPPAEQVMEDFCTAGDVIRFRRDEESQDWLVRSVEGDESMLSPIARGKAATEEYRFTLGGIIDQGFQVSTVNDES